MMTGPSFYSDWGDPREFSIGDIGVGECAGEVVSPIDFELVACEREASKRSCNWKAATSKRPRAWLMNRCCTARRRC
jgi:hypothetical protein